MCDMCLTLWCFGLSPNVCLFAVEGLWVQMGFVFSNSKMYSSVGLCRAAEHRIVAGSGAGLLSVKA